jgi:hypothetical protein
MREDRGSAQDHFSESIFPIPEITARYCPPSIFCSAVPSWGGSCCSSLAEFNLVVQPTRRIDPCPNTADKRNGID